MNAGQLLVVAALFLLILAFIPMDVAIRAYFHPDGHQVSLAVGPLLGLMRLRVLHLEPRRAGKRVSRPRRPLAVRPSGGCLRLILLDAIKSGGILIRRLELDLVLGTGDAAATGMAIGAIWAVISPVIHMGMRFLPPGNRPPRVRISPDFERARLEGRADCILRVNPGYIIVRGGLLGASRVARRAFARHRKGKG